MRVVAYQAKIQFRKQFTTGKIQFSRNYWLLLIKQRYNSESNSQPTRKDGMIKGCCCLSSKDTIPKAIHNFNESGEEKNRLLLIKQRYNSESNSQLRIKE